MQVCGFFVIFSIINHTKILNKEKAKKEPEIYITEITLKIRQSASELLM